MQVDWVDLTDENKPLEYPPKNQMVLLTVTVRKTGVSNVSVGYRQDNGWLVSFRERYSFMEDTDNLLMISAWTDLPDAFRSETFYPVYARLVSEAE